MNCLELFSGTHSVGKVCKELGWNVISVDNELPATHQEDIMTFDYKQYPQDKFDIVWASPPCNSFSKMLFMHKHIDQAKKIREEGLPLLDKTLEIIDFLQPDYFFIENPRGKLRKLKFMQPLPRATVTYCQYGDTRMKPTDIWTNHLDSPLFSNGWKPRPICKNGDSCHVSAPRGSQTGTQGLKGNYLRSQVPYELCKEILLSL